MPYSVGKYAYGICDKTGFRYPLRELIPEIRNGAKTGMMVGYDVVDPDHPQNHLGKFKTDDTQSLLNARPDRIEPATERLLLEGDFDGFFEDDDCCTSFDLKPFSSPDSCDFSEVFLTSFPR